MNVLEEIDRVLQLEIDTLVNLRKCIDDSYAKAIDIFFQCTGKVVVIGMGKSGIIAQKIAATMTSTGTPAISLHPGDGLHGDVGVIQGNDSVLAISKSGETEEVLHLLPYLKQVGAPLICLTANPKSSLANQSDVVLHTPITEEACPLNLAPTSSTTAALVAGDALAMALMKKRGLTPEEFALFHPGGQLGRRLLLTVGDTMRAGEENPTITTSISVRDMLYEMSRKRCGAVSVIDGNGKLLGLITDCDVRDKLEESTDIFQLEITDIMNQNPTSIFSDDKAAMALHIMENRDKPFVVLPVLERASGRVVGMVHVHDLVSKGL